MTKRSPLDPTRIIGSSKPLGFPSYWPSCLLLSVKWNITKKKPQMTKIPEISTAAVIIWDAGTWTSPPWPQSSCSSQPTSVHQALKTVKTVNGRWNHWWQGWPWLGSIYNRVMERRSRNSWVSPDPDLHDFPTNLDSLETQDRRIANAIQSRCATRMTNIIWDVFQNCHKKIAFV